jgi:hypothetical protein
MGMRAFAGAGENAELTARGGVHVVKLISA